MLFGGNRTETHLEVVYSDMQFTRVFWGVVDRLELPPTQHNTAVRRWNSAIGREVSQPEFYSSTGFSPMPNLLCRSPVYRHLPGPTVYSGVPDSREFTWRDGVWRTLQRFLGVSGALPGGVDSETPTRRRGSHSRTRVHHSPSLVVVWTAFWTAERLNDAAQLQFGGRKLRTRELVHGPQAAEAARLAWPLERCSR